MSWARLDDRFHSNPKVDRAGNAAAGVYARSLSYCASYETEGFVPHRWVKRIATAKELGALGIHGLWDKVSEGEERLVTDRRDSGKRPLPDVLVVMPEDGYFIPDFLHFNKSRAEIAQHRRGGSKRDASEKAPAEAPAVSGVPQLRKHRPIPSHPIREELLIGLGTPVEQHLDFENVLKAVEQ